MQPTTNGLNIRNQVVKVTWITFFWTFISVMQFMLTYTAVIQYEFDVSGIDPWPILKGSIVTGLTAGVIGGTTMVLYWEKWLRSKSYGWSLFNIMWSFSAIYLIVATVGGLFLYSTQFDLPFYDPTVIQEFIGTYFGLAQAVSFIFWLFVVAFTIIALLVNDKYGPGVFVSFLLGKYFHPKREERIFMFLDLRSSTVIAERLGERSYFNFLKELYKDITPAILTANGEIYQYVGDEVVVSWKQGDDIQARCVKCFFDIEHLLRSKASYYQQKYDGVHPEFKAGFHSGFAMVGEIGIVKREIAYSGDVLNTTARIQSKCNELGVNILLSSDLLHTTDLLSKSYETKALGAMELRGKRQTVKLYTVSELN